MRPFPPFWAVKPTMTEQTFRGVPDQRHRPRSPADDFSFHRFGGPTVRARGVITVNNVGVQLLPNNPNRVNWWITNLGTQVLTVDWVPAITNSVGILVGGTGGYLSQLIQDDGTAVGDAVYGIVGGADQDVYIYEVSILKITNRRR
ncbi:hypothetical protein LCGC14_1017640 [marine sediment metagenome]|uniref:Uncharacterized protein n=1 Tax=marine sediment metagenome TaxID=412755 RepID=A0A0F9NK27_9ZZZZ